MFVLTLALLAQLTVAPVDGLRWDFDSQGKALCCWSMNDDPRVECFVLRPNQVRTSSVSRARTIRVLPARVRNRRPRFEMIVNDRRLRCWGSKPVRWRLPPGRLQ